MANRRVRGQNEGSIFQRKDGRWCAVLNLGWENGRRKRKSFYGKTAAEAQASMSKAEADLRAGLPVAIERQTVGQFLDRWLDDSVKPRVRLLTYQQYEQHVRLYLGPSFGKVALTKLSPQHVQAFVNGQLKKGLSPRTVQLSLVILRNALDQAVKWSLAARNVAKLVDSPRVRRTEVKPLTPEQARQFLAAAAGERLEAVYRVALALGLRLGETLGLRWQDVDVEGRSLCVTQTLHRVGGKRYGQPGKLQFSEPKTTRSRRRITLPETLVVALRAHRVRQLQERLMAGLVWQDSGLVFATRIGTPIEPRNVEANFKRILIKGELSSAMRFHDLRHSAASLLLAQGVQLRAIMELLGHSTIALTANTYSHVMPAMMDEMAEKMDAILAI